MLRPGWKEIPFAYIQIPHAKNTKYNDFEPLGSIQPDS
jgi:hypothetical protein